MLSSWFVTQLDTLISPYIADIYSFLLRSGCFYESSITAEQNQVSMEKNVKLFQMQILSNCYPPIGNTLKLCRD